MAGGFSPLDDELELVPGSLTPCLAEHLVHLGTWMPFSRAACELERFTGVALAEATARRLTERAGAAYAAVQTEEVAALRRDLPEVPAGPAIQQLSVDGAMVPLVHGVWAEVKTLAVGTVGDPVWEGGHWQVHTGELSYFSRMTDHRTFADLALVELQRRGTERAGVVCAVADGAEWIQRFVDLHRPDAVRILDFGHAAESVARAGEAVLRAGTPQYRDWLATQLHDLKTQDPEQVLQALRELRLGEEVEGKREPPPAEALKIVEESLAYLEKRREHIQYASFQAQGYPIGSGSVESAHNLVMESRLKGGGMHWAPEHVDPMLALRTVACSDRWDEAWPQIVVQLRSERQARHRARQEHETVAADRDDAAIEPVPEETSPPPAATEEPAAVASSQEHDPEAEPERKRWRPPANHPWRGWSLKSKRTARGRARASAEI